MPGPVLEVHRDERGVLCPVDFEKLPFLPRRLFVIDDVPPGTVRGGHGHRSGSQMFFALSGRIEVEFGAMATGTQSMVLEPGRPGLLIPAGVVTWQRFESPGSRLLVLASSAYDPGDYVQAGEDAAS